MNGSEEAVPTVVLPERLDRPVGFGPFPSATDALKFLAVGAIGAVLALRWGPLAWTPFLGGGLLLALHRREGASPDERAWQYLRWRLGHGARLPRPRRAAPGGIARSADGDPVVGLEAGGLPIAYLPARDAERLFDAYRRFLRGRPGPIAIVLGRARIPPQPFLPRADRPVPGAEGSARAGYVELVRLLARRRSRRRVRVLLFGAPFGGEGGSLARERAAWESFFAGLDLPFRRLDPAEVGSEIAAHPGSGA